MLRLICCCCFSDENSLNERQPLLQSTTSDPNEPGSARQKPPAHSANTAQRTGRLLMRRVGVAELDQRFSEVAETFNEQQQEYEVMVRHVNNLQQSCGCAHGVMLAFADCVVKIAEEYEAKYTVSLQMRGYDFSLSVVPVDSECLEEPLPLLLKLAQDELRGASQSAKATISKATTLQELLGWLLRSSEQIVKQVKEAAPSYQEQGRLSGNLEENMREVRRAKELSLEYKQKAGEVLTEAAHIAGANV